jgi:hypothetical protein
MCAQIRALPHAPEELTKGRLRRLGEGIGKVVYASPHWVVKRERPASEIIALIVMWRFFRRAKRLLPAGFAERLMRRPTRRIRFLRLLTQGLVLIVPRSVWFNTHIGQLWKLYRSRDIRGERLARTRLAGTSLVPDRVTFPPTRVRVAGWPIWLTVTEATQRLEETLHQRLTALAKAGRFDEVEQWLDRYLELRQAGWQQGLFSMDAHLKNFGVRGNSIVLLDPGGLTDNWAEIESRLSVEEVVAEPHIQLGLGEILALKPEIAARFNARWKDTVCREGVLRNWPTDPPSTGRYGPRASA